MLSVFASTRKYKQFFNKAEQIRFWFNDDMKNWLHVCALQRQYLPKTLENVLANLSSIKYRINLVSTDNTPYNSDTFCWLQRHR
jgi:hypothetical protein